MREREGAWPVGFVLNYLGEIWVVIRDMRIRRLWLSVLCNNSPPERLEEGSGYSLWQDVKDFFLFLVISNAHRYTCTDEDTLLKLNIIPISIHICSGAVYQEATSIKMSKCSMCSVCISRPSHNPAPTYAKRKPIHVHETVSVLVWSVTSQRIFPPLP